MDERLAREYRKARREPWNTLSATPAQGAMVKARASIRGWDLVMSADDDREGGRSWEVDDIGAGITVLVRQIPDDSMCDCWDWAKENPRDDGKEDDIPSHGHFGIVAEATQHGRIIAEDSCWGFVWDWPGQDDERELAYAFDEVAGQTIDAARDAAWLTACDWAALPQWVRDAVLIRGDDWETYPPAVVS